MSDRQFVKNVRGVQCDICGKEIIDWDSRTNGEWNHLLDKHMQKKDKTTPLTFRWWKRNLKPVFPINYFIRYDFHADCFNKNVKKLFPKAKQQEDK